MCALHFLMPRGKGLRGGGRGQPRDERREGCRHWEVLVQATEAIVADAGG